MKISLIQEKEFYEKGSQKDLANFTGRHLYHRRTICSCNKRETPIWIISFEICKNFMNTDFVENFRRLFLK